MYHYPKELIVAMFHPKRSRNNSLATLDFGPWTLDS